MSQVEQPIRSGKKAVVFMTIGVLVEVQESNDFYDMTEQANDKVRQHVRAGSGFMPFRVTTDMVQDGTTVNELANKLTIQPGTDY